MFCPRVCVILNKISVNLPSLSHAGKDKSCQAKLNEKMQCISPVSGQKIPYASRVYDSAEMVNLVDSALEFWLTSGRYTEEFEKKLAE